MAKNETPRPRDLLTERGLRNALIVLQAIGGSTNGIVHLAAMAGRAGIAIQRGELPPQTFPGTERIPA